MNLLHLACIELGKEDAAQGLSFVRTVHECLHSANFWEQDNIRCEATRPTVFQTLLTSTASFFAVLHARTAFLDTVNVAKKAKRRASDLSESQAWDAVKAYTFLLYPSSECIPKSSRNDFLRRAVILDTLLGCVANTSIWAIQVVRTFLSRTLSFLGSWEHDAGGQYLHHLMTSPVLVSTEQVTMDLVQGHLR